MNAPAGKPLIDLLRQTRVVAALRVFLAEEQVLFEGEDTRPYECDGLSAYRQVPMVVALPSTEEQVARILKTCHEIDQLESEADREMRGAMSRLFRDEPDVRELIKYKAIYELLETVTDRCEDVANLIEGIVVENS